ncbi:unnamed protein product [Protopolystoma xenopodis]|uniref:Uncharacterized protein n=1 Tax=Protopolystoma xenopodis TaxID=117903 RepID=A0A448XPZ1_9PLAT|nr:unnamed protein product [Protopolystoma xenopodis]
MDKMDKMETKNWSPPPVAKAAVDLQRGLELVISKTRLKPSGEVASKPTEGIRRHLLVEPILESLHPTLQLETEATRLEAILVQGLIASLPIEIVHELVEPSRQIFRAIVTFRRRGRPLRRQSCQAS